MPRRVLNLFKFRLERLLLRGPQYRLLLIAALIGLVSVTAGTLVYYLDADRPDGFAATVWWAFLRLTDPGYLGDDVGVVERVVSTVLTVLGYVLFLGALIAIMTQWLNERMAELEAGLTPIAQRDHVLIVGWTNRTSTIVGELMLSEGRVRRFLRQRRVRRLRIAILADAVTTALIVELRDRLGSLWNERQVILRTGSPLRIEHLRRVDFQHAAVVILPAADFAAGGPSQVDTRAIKTLLSIANHPQTEGARLPLAVAEIYDARKIQIARAAYGGPIEILASDAIIGRLIAQNVRHRGLSHVYGELLTHGRGNEIYIRDAADVEGLSFSAAVSHFPGAILLGVVRPHGDSFRSVLNPPADLRIESDDRLALLAHSYEKTGPLHAPQDIDTRAVLPDHAAAAVHGGARREPSPAVRKRVLVLGWSHKVPALLREFDSYTDDEFHIDVVSSTPVAQRDEALLLFEFESARITQRQLAGDYTTPSVLERLEPGGYDSIVLIGTDVVASGEESDARSILAYLLLRDMLPEEGGPPVLIELLDAANVALFRRRRGEVIISPVILSHMLAQVALRRELRAVFDELFGPDGAEIRFHSPADLGLAGATCTFRRIEAAAAERGQIALGVAASTARVMSLNPERSRVFELDHSDRIVLLR